MEHETGYPIVDSEYSWTADGTTPICKGYVGTHFYRAAQTWVVRIPHLELAEPFVWTGDTNQLADQIRALAPPSARQLNREPRRLAEAGVSLELEEPREDRPQPLAQRDARLPAQLGRGPG